MRKPCVNETKLSLEEQRNCSSHRELIDYWYFSWIVCAACGGMFGRVKGFLSLTEVSLMKQNRKPCVRCLLRDMDEKETYQSLQRYLDSFDEEIRAAEGEYERRLGICRQCESLQEGICGKCGCFVEARALRKRGTCPHEEPRW